MIKLNKLLLVLILGLCAFAISAKEIKSAYTLDLPNSESPNEYFAQNNGNKRETDREKTIRLLDYMDKIEDAIVLFDKDIYNQYMNLLKVDTSFQFTFKCHYEAYLVLYRCMNEGEHKFDITEYEYEQLDSIAYSPLTNASAFARLYLMGYDAYKEDLERRLSIEGTSENDKEVQVYPNPAKNQLNVVLALAANEKIENIRFFDLNGKHVQSNFQYLLNNYGLQLIWLEPLPHGTYFVQVNTNLSGYIAQFSVFY